MYSRLRVRSLIALEGVREVVLVVHVAVCAQVVVEAHLAFPTHTHDPVFLAAVADDVRVADTYGKTRQYALGFRGDRASGQLMSRSEWPTSVV